VVNIAAFIVHHLAEFRLVITVLAFVSAMMLNSWTGLSAYRRFKDSHRGHALVHESNQDIVLIAGMAVIIIAAAVTSLFCWLGLSDEKSLPNATTFLTGVIAIIVPIVLQRLFKGGTDRAASTRPTGIPGATPPATTPFADAQTVRRQ